LLLGDDELTGEEDGNVLRRGEAVLTLTLNTRPSAETHKEEYRAVKKHSGGPRANRESLEEEEEEEGKRWEGTFFCRK